MATERTSSPGRTASGNVIVGALPAKATFSPKELSAVERSRKANQALRKQVASDVSRHASK